MAQAVRVRGLREFQRAVSKADRETNKRFRARFKRVGEIVQRPAAGLFAKYDAKSAAGFRPVVRARGVAVEQRYGKTTGQRPDFGHLQMAQALIPALEANEGAILREFELALDELADIVEG